MAEPHAEGAERSLDDLSWMLAPDPEDGCQDLLLGTGAERCTRLDRIREGQPRLGLFHVPGNRRAIRHVLVLLHTSRAPLLAGLVDTDGPVATPSTRRLAEAPDLLLWHLALSGTLAAP